MGAPSLEVDDLVDRECPNPGKDFTHRVFGHDLERLGILVVDLVVRACPVADDEHAAGGCEVADELQIFKPAFACQDLVHDAGQEHHVVPARTLLEIFSRAEGGSSVPHGGFDGGADVVALVHAASGFDALTDTALDGHAAPVVEDARAHRDVRG